MWKYFLVILIAVIATALLQQGCERYSFILNHSQIPISDTIWDKDSSYRCYDTGEHRYIHAIKLHTPKSKCIKAIYILEPDTTK